MKGGEIGCRREMKEEQGCPKSLNNSVKRSNTRRRRSRKKRITTPIKRRKKKHKNKYARNVGRSRSIGIKLVRSGRRRNRRGKTRNRISKRVRS